MMEPTRRRPVRLSDWKDRAAVALLVVVVGTCSLPRVRRRPARSPPTA